MRMSIILLWVALLGCAGDSSSETNTGNNSTASTFGVSGDSTGADSGGSSESGDDDVCEVGGDLDVALGLGVWIGSRASQCVTSNALAPDHFALDCEDDNDYLGVEVEPTDRLPDFSPGRDVFLRVIDLEAVHHETEKRRWISLRDGDATGDLLLAHLIGSEITPPPPDSDFWAPVVVQRVPDGCPVEVGECVERSRVALDFALGDEVVRLVPEQEADLGPFHIYYNMGWSWWYADGCEPDTPPSMFSIMITRPNG